MKLKSSGAARPIHAREWQTGFDHWNEHLLICDESWLYYEYLHDWAWAPSKASLPTRKADKIAIKNAWFSLFGRSMAFAVFLFGLPGCNTMRNAFVDLFCSAWH
jgi:hypothetical protein